MGIFSSVFCRLFEVFDHFCKKLSSRNQLHIFYEIEYIYGVEGKRRK
jgi:hypothetical protein